MKAVSSTVLPAPIEPAASSGVAPRGWLGTLSLDYRRSGDRTLAHDRHDGPLRVLQALYPEGPGICQHVLVHPPGGMVGGDRLHIDVSLQPGAHALLTTPGAARFYRSAGGVAGQTVRLQLAAGARLEWLPLETLAYSGCAAENRLTMALQGDAEMIGWDVLALGLPAAGQGFSAGEVLQHLALEGAWLERGRIAADDLALRDGPTGLAGHRVLATMWFASGEPIAPKRAEALLEGARGACAAAEAPAARAPVAASPDAAAALPGAPRPGRLIAGATAPDARLVVLRVLADRVEPVMQLLGAVRAAWRQTAWGLAGRPPRIWRT
jgi:urease accessory protein